MSAFLRATMVVCLLCSPVVLQAQHRFIAQDKGRLSIVSETGKIEWSMNWGGIHDIHSLDNGNIFTHRGTELCEIEINSKKVVWEFDCKKLFPDIKIEVHSFLPQSNGDVIVAVSGAGKIIRINRKGEILKQFVMKLLTPHPHKDSRLMRSAPNGNLIVSHEGDGYVREYTVEGELVWEYPIPMFGRTAAGGHGVESFGNSVFSALRLDNGNILICTGNGHSIIEVTPEKEIVWSLHQNELEGIQLAWVTTMEVLPNGNRIFGNCHAGPENPQLIEITPDKKVVWSFKDFDNFGNSLSNSMLLSAQGVNKR